MGFSIERLNCKSVPSRSYKPSKLPLQWGLCYITPNRLMDQVLFPIRNACVYSDIQNTPEHLTFNLCTANPPPPPAPVKNPERGRLYTGYWLKVIRYCALPLQVPLLFVFTQWLQEPTMLRYWVQRYSHSKGEFINMVQLVMFLFTIVMGNLSEK